MSLWGWKSQVASLEESLTWLTFSLRSAADSRGAGNPTYSYGIVPEELDVVKTGELQTLVGREPGTAPGRMKKSAVLGTCDRARRWLPALCSCITVKLQEGGRWY